MKKIFLEVFFSLLDLSFLNRIFLDIFLNLSLRNNGKWENFSVEEMFFFKLNSPYISLCTNFFFTFLGWDLYWDDVMNKMSYARPSYIVTRYKNINIVYCI